MREKVVVVANCKVTVEINGVNYTLGGAKEEAYYYRLGKYVERNIEQLQKAYRGINDTDASVMAALSIADELLTLKDELETTQNDREAEKSTEIPSKQMQPQAEKKAESTPKDAFIPQGSRRNR